MPKSDFCRIISFDTINSMRSIFTPRALNGTLCFTVHPLCTASRVQRPSNCAPPSSRLERLESGKENGGWEQFERFGISVTAFSYKGDYSPISRQPSFVGSQPRNRFPGKNVRRVAMGVAT